MTWLTYGSSVPAGLILVIHVEKIRQIRFFPFEKNIARIASCNLVNSLLNG